MGAADPDRPPLTLVVYGREHCHLCEDMIAALQELQVRLPFRLDVIDVDSDSDLRSRYGERVPVLVAEGEEICHYHLDPVAVARIFPSPRDDGKLVSE
ncbi:Glutaredoxin-like domain [Nitrosovibrio sp. Nv6]|nr:glutaredoxin family protein [Nitrosovibrio sp. Nv6]SEO68260.1 Glutaredoxin-like domain [Nitrosovibrio sp. Nv6]